MIKTAFENDKLCRKELAQNFKDILLNTDLKVFSVSAPWGCGKTYFIENLISLMENDSINILYNAWESDFYESPLIPLLIEILHKIEQVDNKTKLEEDIKLSKNIAEKICKKSSFQMGFDLGFVNCAANFDPNKKMIDSEYIELKSEIKDFKNRLKNIQEKLNKKIIIFIDELDRCHPMYTIRTLEIIKHFFGIPNIIFVLSVDKKQIENSVRQIFGVNMGEENGYLRKFIDIDFQLPTPSMEQLAYYNLTQIWHKFDRFINNHRYYTYNMQFRPIYPAILPVLDYEHDQVYLSSLISEIANRLNFSLRDLEKFFMRLSLTVDILTKEDILFLEPIILFNFLALNNIEEIDNYVNLNSSNIIIQIKNILIIWNGIFKSYKQNLIDFQEQGFAKENTARDNVLKINNLLNKVLSDDLNAQEKYIQNYPNKIKFISNFM